MPQDYYPSGPFLSQLPDAGEFDVLREDFLLGFAERTARAYKADLEDFREWCVRERVDPTRPSATDLEQFMRSVRERGLAAGTVARRAMALRGFVRHLQRSRSG
jgi:site-specific recombinase XerD